MFACPKVPQLGNPSAGALSSELRSKTKFALRCEVKPISVGCLLGMCDGALTPWTPCQIELCPVAADKEEDGNG